MNRLFRALRWLLVAFAVTALTALVAELALRPSSGAVDTEQYAVLSAYIEPGLTGYSHDLGSRDGLLVIAARTTFSESLPNSNKFEQYTALVSSTSRAKRRVHELSRSLLFEFRVTNLWNVTLEPKFRLPVRYELATEPEMKLYPYEAFLRRFPNSYGMLTFTSLPAESLTATEIVAWCTWKPFWKRKRKPFSSSCVASAVVCT